MPTTSQQHKYHIVSSPTAPSHSSHTMPSTQDVTSPPSALTPSGLVHKEEDQDSLSETDHGSERTSEDSQPQYHAGNVDYLKYDEGFYASLPSLSPKLSLSTYCLPPKVFDKSKPTFDATETVPITIKKHDYEEGREVSLYGTRDQSLWIPKEIVIDFKTGPITLISKEPTMWSNPAEARAHAFARAHSNRYVAMMLAKFQEELFGLWSKKETAKVRQMHKDASFLKVHPLYVLQTACDKKENRSPWLIAESPTDSRNHRYIYDYEFFNKNYHMKLDKNLEDVIYAFVHFTNERSGGLSLIAQLDCDAHGKLSNLICYTKVQPPSSLCFPGMFESIEMSFVHMQRQHDCNNVCHTLGLTRFDPNV